MDNFEFSFRLIAESDIFNDPELTEFLLVNRKELWKLWNNNTCLSDFHYDVVYVRTDISQDDKWKWDNCWSQLKLFCSLRKQFNE